MEVFLEKTKIIAELGINTNGSLEITKKLIKVAKKSGCDAVKFQKRTIDVVYSKEELDKYRESPWGTTNREQKNALEFGKEQYDEIDKYCKQINIDWFASAWDLESQFFLKQYGCKYNKIASAMLTYKEFLEEVAKERKYTFISTGMSSEMQIDKAVRIFEKYRCPYELMHCCSEYPMPIEKANLLYIKTLKNRYGCDVGYSDHSTGIITSVAAICLGASSIERHITLDRSSYGSDQAASLEPVGLKKMIEYIRSVELSLGSGEKEITEKEKEIEKKLRRINNI